MKYAVDSVERMPDETERAFDRRLAEFAMTLADLRAAGLEESVWGQRILSAAAKGKFTDTDRRDSGRWVTCACGCVTLDIPRRQSGAPNDLKLLTLGVSFPENVYKNKFLWAATDLIKIEQRATWLVSNWRQRIGILMRKYFASGEGKP
jgi:hypothetical protein